MPKQYGTPGPRAIHPSICTSKSLGSCSLLAQLLFDRLIAQADDQGRIEDGAEYVRGVCIPLLGKVTVKAVEAALAELAADSVGMIQRYRAGGRDLIQLLGWWTFQSGMRWRYPSRYLPPEGWVDSVKVPGPDGKTPEPDGNIPSSNGTMPPSRADAHPPVDRTGPMPDQTGPDRAARESDDDPALDALSAFINAPTSSMLSFLSDIERQYGSEATARAIGEAGMADPNRGTLLSRTRAILAIRERGAERRERDDEARRNAGKRAPVVLRQPERVLTEDEIEAEIARYTAERAAS